MMRSNKTYTSTSTAIVIFNNMRSEVNNGSYQYLRRSLLRSGTQMDSSHLNSIVQVVRVIGDAEEIPSGICMIVGTPGTGKLYFYSSIMFIIGALLDHGLHGHKHDVNRPQFNVTKQ